MNAIRAIFMREVKLFFDSLIAYVIMVVFLVGVGSFFWLFSGNILESGAADLDALFSFGPWFFLFLVPALTMRSFSEEFKSGTIEFLSTKPISDWEIILGKYFAAVFLVLFCLMLTLVYYGSVYYLSEPIGNIDNGSIIGAYFGLFGIGAVFAAIGLFASTLTESQIVAFVLGVFLCFFLFSAFDFIADLSVFRPVSNIIIQIGVNEHYRSISRGVVDSRDVLYYLTVVVLFLLYSKGTLMSKKA